ncbi:hypothetical protein [uncultured Methanomethylovorans sp.]|uniref:hypothetical protein n=1 Tax=uncultured Methanomethylovorans sp. TaxID=183759 RepID=UPI002AA7188F|nr:hypothetical protein [uncultured Methanomethylovorans sp.]
MTSLSTKFIELIGCFFGAIFCIIWVFFVLAVKSSQDLGQIDEWLTSGPIIFFVTLGHYLFSRDMVSEKRRIDDIVGLRSTLWGYFLWLIVMILTYRPEVDISSTYTVEVGYLFILLIHLLMKSNYYKKTASKNEKAML